MRSKEGIKHKSQMLHCRGRVETNVGKIKKKLKNRNSIGKICSLADRNLDVHKPGKPSPLVFPWKQGQEAILQKRPAELAAKHL